ncbi:FkbM family methyltransferase [Desulfovibrio sp. SGI.169]|uniref:FkbM family methyltransferase n=1 Tax=Desulfovibrio sp. SGI.169 TaxID=3420561 RepID=UPI003CFEBB3F
MKIKNILNPASYYRRLKKIAASCAVYAALYLHRLAQWLAQKNLTWGIAALPQRKNYIEASMLPIAGCQLREVPGEEASLYFYVTNPLTAFRVETFYTKEPETLQWIEGFSDNEVLWDIGANIGLYSVYAAKKRNAKVYAFEPSVFNLALLAKNIHANKLTRNITVVPLALSRDSKSALFKIGGDDGVAEGGACSSFDADFDFSGNPFKTDFSYQTAGITGDALCSLNIAPEPNYIKLDVDGIEHYILAGLQCTLKKDTVKSILVECNDAFCEQASGIANMLAANGFALSIKTHSEMFDNGGVYSKTYNQIWIRERHNR